MPLRLKDQIYATVNSDAIYNGTYKLTLPAKAGTVALTSDGVASATTATSATSSTYGQYLEGNGRINSADIAHMYTNNDVHQRLDISSASMTTGRPATDGYINTYMWDNTGNYDTQVFFPNGAYNNGGRPQIRFKAKTNSDFTWSDWKDLAYLDDIPAGLTVDSALSTTSTNPVQNKVINTALGTKANSADLATVATSGSYNDLSNKPTIPAAQVQSNWTQTTTTAVDYIKNKPTLATVATSGSYNDLSNKPTIPTVNNATLTIQKNGTNVQTFTANSSTNKTANITVPTTVAELSDASSYATTAALAGKQDTLTAGDNISITSNTISADTGMVYLGKASLSATSNTLTINLSTTYDNYRVIGCGGMATGSNTYIDLQMLDGSTPINNYHQVQRVVGTGWSSEIVQETSYANNTWSVNASEGFQFEMNVYRSGTNWTRYDCVMGSGGGLAFHTAIANGRNVNATKPTGFRLVTGATFDVGAWIKVWGWNNN